MLTVSNSCCDSEDVLPQTLRDSWILGRPHGLLLSLQPCVIADCGQHQDGDSWGTAPSDGSGDTHPEFPEDSDVDFKDVSSSVRL